MANPDMQREFLRDPEGKLRKREGAEGKKRKATSMPAKPMNIKTKGQEIRTAYLAGIRDERMREMLEQGAVECERCNDATGELDPHHVVPRSRGARYKPGAPGIDEPGNIWLVCRRCHGEIES